jgi:hypothetical protein
LALDYDAYGARVMTLEPLRGRQGVCAVHRLSVRALGASEEFLLLAATCGDDVLDAELTDRLLALPGDWMALPRANDASGSRREVESTSAQPSLDFQSAHVPTPARLQAELDRQRSLLLRDLESRNLELFTAETEKLDAWADDQRAGLEHEIKNLDRTIKEVRSRGKAAATLAEKLQAQREQRDLEAQRDKRRRELFQRQDEVQQRRDRIVEDLETQLREEIAVTELAIVEWELR